MNKSKYKMVQMFFVAVFISMINFGCGEEQADAPPVVKPVKTITVSGFGEGEITFPAQVEAGEKVLMSFRVSGRIIELPVKEGEEQVMVRFNEEQHILPDEAKFIKTDAVPGDDIIFPLEKRVDRGRGGAFGYFNQFLYPDDLRIAFLGEF